MYASNQPMFNMRKTLFGGVCAMMIAVAMPVAHAEDQKPTEVVTLTFGKIEHSYKVDGSSGPDVAVEGTLHIGSKALLAPDGTVVGFMLHSDLSDARAETIAGAQSYAAVGASDGIPVECQPAACAPSSWTLTFRLMPKGSVLQSSLLFDLTLRTQYTADGSLSKVCVAGQDDCDEGVIP